uniref:Uncharacterized protein n=1 Tax=Anguilla anguilla TaxID=7936 RepID=A0A0E9TWX0_ANGAN
MGRVTGATKNVLQKISLQYMHTYYIQYTVCYMNYSKGFMSIHFNI